jgi:hypothetical protein
VLQSKESGARANEWGRETARRLALKLGAVSLSMRSNEFDLEGERVVIKCAQRKTTSVGVPYQMLGRLDLVVGAFERDDGVFELLALTPAQYERVMRDTRSRGASAGRVGIVARSEFEKYGRVLGRCRI